MEVFIINQSSFEPEKDIRFTTNEEGKHIKASKKIPVLYNCKGDNYVKT